MKSVRKVAYLVIGDLMIAKMTKLKTKLGLSHSKRFPAKINHLRVKMSRHC